MKAAAIITAFVSVTASLPALADTTNSVFRPIRPGEVTVSGTAAGGFQLIQVTGQLGAEVAYGLTPSLEVALQAQPITWIRGMGNADPWQFNQLDGGLSLRWFPGGSEHLWYIAPALRAGRHTYNPIVGPGFESGLEARISDHLVVGAGTEAVFFLIPGSSNWLARLGLQTRVGYRF
jgi:hypothetical protein